MTKRKFLSILSGAIAGIVALPFFKPGFHRLANSLVPQLPAHTGSGTLSATELENLVALGEILVDNRDLSTDEKDSLRAHINDRTQNDDGYFSLYQITAQYLSNLGPRAFAELSREERSSLAQRNRLTQYHLRRRECLFPWGREERLVRALAVPDLIAGFYRSSAGWAVVHYEIYPGRCGDLNRYRHAQA